MNVRGGWLIAVLGCGDPSKEPEGGPEEADADADSDADADADSDSDTDADADADADTDAEPACDGVRFAAEGTDWSLPDAPINSSAPYYGIGGSYSYGTCQDGSLNGTAAWEYSVLDLTGDGQVDLVTFLDECGEPGIGKDRWVVYEGTSAGLSDSPSSWSLPEAPINSSAPYYGMSGSYSYGTCADGSLSGTAAWEYSVLDLTGDGQVDLVTFLDECGEPGIGKDHWVVYEGTGDGFAEVGASWSLPDAPINSSAPYYGIGGSYSYGTCADGSLSGTAAWEYSVFDLTGDGRVDLVTFLDECGEPGVGKEHWVVHEGTGAGFSASGERWSLPGAPINSSAPYYGIGGSYSYGTCADGSLSGTAAWDYSVFDVTGDGAPDLVTFLDECGEPGVGKDRWVVYEGGSGGFAATATAWSLPEAPINSSAPYYGIGGSYSYGTCQDGSLNGTAAWEYSVLDLTGDGQVDLVTFLDECADPGVGKGWWKVHPGAKGGFAAEGADWTLPDAPINSSAPYYGLGGSYSYGTCADGSLNGTAAWDYSVFDATGDGRVDLVTFLDECDAAGVGKSFWRVNAGECGP